MPQLDPVVLKFEADLGSYQRGVSQATKVSEEAFARIDRAGYNTGVALRKGFDLAKGAAVAFGLSLGADAIAGAIVKGLEYASSLQDISQQLGVTTTALQEYRYAGSQSGLTTQETDTALRQLTKSLGEAAANTKTQAQAFDALKISVRDAEGKVIDAGRALPMIADALQKIESPAERSRILIDLFGESAQKLEPLLAGGSTAINRLRDAAHELGIVLSEDQIQRADETANKLEAVKQVLEANIASAVANNANAIIVLANAFERLASAVAGAIGMYQQFKLNQGAFESNLNAWAYGLSPLPSDQAKAASFRAQGQRFRTALTKPPQTPPGQSPVGIGRSAPTEKTVFGRQSDGQAPFSPNYHPKPAKVRTPRVRKGRTGPSEAEIEQRFQNERNSLMAQYNSAMRSQVTSAEEEAEYELRNVELARLRTKASIENDKDYSKAQKDRLLAQLDELAEAERAGVERDKQRRLEGERQDLLDEINQAGQDALRLQYDLADTEADRRRIALSILDAEDAYLKSKLEAVIASQTTTDAEKERARIALAALDAQAGARRESVERQFEGPLARYARDAKDAKTRVEEAAAERIRDLNETIADTMSKALGVKDPFLRELLRIFLDQNVFGPLAEALSRRSGGGGLLGGILNAVGLIGGAVGGGGAVKNTLNGKRAMGGPVSAGGAYLVGENGPEVLKMGATPGFVIPNHAAFRGGGSTVVQHFHLDARGAVMTQDLVNQINTMGQVAADAGARGGHAASMNEIRKLQRPRL